MTIAAILVLALGTYAYRIVGPALGGRLNLSEPQIGEHTSELQSP